jgi:ketosteroid isomerase-like protein/GNAT superfamily N-acetyltransferase
VSPATLPAGYDVRRARVEECAALPAIEREAAALFAGSDLEAGVRRDVTSLEDFRAAQAAGRLWVALAPDGALVGFALADLLDGHLHLDEIDVRPAHGRRGVGSALVGAVATAARRMETPAITLTTFRDVPWNAPFYARLGFRVLDPNKQLVRDWVVALSDGDADRVCAMYADDLRYFVVGDWPLGGTFGRAHMERNCRDVFTVFPYGLRFTAERLIAEGDWVCLEMRSHGEHVSGRTYRNHYTYWFEIRDGRIHQLREWVDTLHANEVLCAGARKVDFEGRRT